VSKDKKNQANYQTSRTTTSIEASKPQVSVLTWSAEVSSIKTDWDARPDPRLMKNHNMDPYPPSPKSQKPS
jgi:hypothetical protein